MSTPRWFRLLRFKVMGRVHDVVLSWGRRSIAKMREEIDAELSPKRPTYWALGDGEGPGHLGSDLKHAVRCISDDIEATLEILNDGEEYAITVGRRDMTQEEEDAIPEV